MSEVVAVGEVVGLHHVGIAVNDLDAALERYVRLYGARVDVRAQLPDQGVEAVALALRDGTAVELLQPLAPGEGSVAQFLKRRGEGMHHLAFAVPDVAAQLAHVKREGGRLIDEVPRPGLHGHPVAFVHPATSFGVLVEFVEVQVAASGI